MSLEVLTLNSSPSDWRSSGIEPGSVDVVVAVPPFRPADLGLPFCLDALPRRGWPYIRWVRSWLSRALQFLRPNGHFYVYGLPAWLPHFLEPLQNELEFKYWIAVQTTGRSRKRKLKAEHMALAFFAAPGKKFRCNKVRYPHPICAACGRTQKDYGGRSHLLNPEGCSISDVWKDLEVDPAEAPPDPVLERVLAISNTRDKGQALVLKPTCKKPPRIPYPFQLQLPFEQTRAVDVTLLDQVYEADIVKFLQRLPSNSIDLAFADPPYNLQKEYADYSDDQAEEAYLRWCQDWLQEYARVLKPGGALMALNLPKWSITAARDLSQRLHLRNWIVWDSLSEPKGKLMPAHYALLYFTKGPTPRVFNYDEGRPSPDDVEPPDAPVYCLRQSCRRRRKAAGEDPKVALSDIWSDLHRVRHRRDRDHHPCQLPDAFMDRIIELTTRPGDVVLDALCGAGTTAIEARRLGRHYIAADLDPKYVEISAKKLVEVNLFGAVQRVSTRKGPKRDVTKRELQLELVRVAEKLGRAPTRKDAETHSQYSLELYDQAFPTWSKALGAVRASLAKGASS